MIAEFTVGETKFETCLSGHLECVEGPMPFTTPNLIDLGRCGRRARREPTTAPVCRHSDRDGDPAVRLLGHQEATPDRLVVLMRRQHQRRTGKQELSGGSTRHRLHPSPGCTNRWALHYTRGESEQDTRTLSPGIDRASRVFGCVSSISLHNSVTPPCFPSLRPRQRVPPTWRIVKGRTRVRRSCAAGFVEARLEENGCRPSTGQSLVAAQPACVGPRDRRPDSTGSAAVIDGFAVNLS